jgi:hypothetical protein
MRFSVTYWDAHPESGEDACGTGFDFDTASEAWKQFHDNDPRYTSGRHIHWRYVMIDATGLNGIRANPAFNDPAVRRSHALDDAAWRREIAMEAGMGLGVEAYNDAMGYGYGEE